MFSLLCDIPIPVISEDFLPNVQEVPGLFPMDPAHSKSTPQIASYHLMNYVTCEELRVTFSDPQHFVALLPIVFLCQRNRVTLHKYGNVLWKQAAIKNHHLGNVLTNFMFVCNFFDKFASHSSYNERWGDIVAPYQRYLTSIMSREVI